MDIIEDNKQRSLSRPYVRNFIKHIHFTIQDFKLFCLLKEWFDVIYPHFATVIQNWIILCRMWKWLVRSASISCDLTFPLWKFEIITSSNKWWRKCFSDCKTHLEGVKTIDQLICNIHQLSVSVMCIILCRPSFVTEKHTDTAEKIHAHTYCTAPFMEKNNQFQVHSWTSKHCLQDKVSDNDLECACVPQYVN